MPQGNLPLAKHTEVKINGWHCSREQRLAPLLGSSTLRISEWWSSFHYIHFSNDLANVIENVCCWFFNFCIFFLGFTVSICQLPLAPPQRSFLQWEQWNCQELFCQQFTLLWLLESLIVCFCITHTYCYLTFRSRCFHTGTGWVG